MLALVTSASALVTTPARVGRINMVESWYDAQVATGSPPAAAVATPPAAAVTSAIVPGNVDLSAGAVSARISAAIDRSYRPGLEPYDRFRAFTQEGIYRITDEERKPSAQGPPFTMPSGIGWDVSTEPKNREDMKELAIKLNPVVGFWDPLNIITDDRPEAIGWWRHAEIKHGRVAMAGFVGYCAHANGVHFPWNIQGPIPFIPGCEDIPVLSFADIAAAGGPADQWDALPTMGKVQILLVIGFLEMHGENSVALQQDGQAHYVRGGKPGYYPKLRGNYPHPVPLDLWDPFNGTGKMSAERKEKALLAEVNNGRLAMLGLMGMISASKGLIVPGLDNLGIPPYDGNIMGPFTAADASLPFVEFMATQTGIPVLASVF